MIRLSKHDYVILHAALSNAIDDDSDPWLMLTAHDHGRAEEIREALAEELESSGEWDLDDAEEEAEADEDDDGLDFGGDDE